MSSATDWRQWIEIGVRDFKDGAELMPISGNCTVAAQFQQGMDSEHFK
jgi:hypothetical protein